MGSALLSYIVIFIGLLLNILGVIAVFFPIIPGGVFFGYIAILLLYWLVPVPVEPDILSSEPLFSTGFLVIFGIIHLFGIVAEYLAPLLGGKMLRFSTKGMWGSLIGSIVGMFILPPPFGFILGAVIGTVVGEYLNGRSLNTTMKLSGYTLLINLTLLVAKLVLGIFTFYYFVEASYRIVASSFS